MMRSVAYSDPSGFCGTSPNGAVVTMRSNFRSVVCFLNSFGKIGCSALTFLSNSAVTILSTLSTSAGTEALTCMIVCSYVPGLRAVDGLNADGRLDDVLAVDVAVRVARRNLHDAKHLRGGLRLIELPLDGGIADDAVFGRGV